MHFKITDIGLQVTQNHIDKGQKGECESCPVALAILEKVKPGIGVAVMGHVAVINVGKTNEYRSFMPQDVRNFINYFDCGIPQKPFAFRMDIPEEFLV